jgi:cytidylate kinase
MIINNFLIKHYLKNVLFINRTAYAGKSTMVKMIAEKYGLLHCGENYNYVPEGIVTSDKYPNICYTKTMKNWQEYLSRTPDEYNNWIIECSKEYEEFEITYLMNLPKSPKIIVDTNISLETLREISDYNQVAIMLSPISMSVEHFFEREDPDKKYIKEQILKAENPEKTMENYLAGIAKINSQENYDKWANSGFFKNHSREYKKRYKDGNIKEI